jgi:CBS domain-containing protein
LSIKSITYFLEKEHIPFSGRVKTMQLTPRQQKIMEIVKEHGPITGERIAKLLNLTRSTLRPDLSILTMAGILAARPRVGYYYNGRSLHSMLAELVAKYRVKEIKSLPVVILETTTVYDAIVTMFTEDVGTLVVVGEGGILEGVVSRKDLLKSALGKMDINKIPVGIIMTRVPKVVTTTPEETVLSAARKMIDNEIDALPVVRPVLDSSGKEKLEVIGRLTKTNIARLFLEVGEGG